MLTRFLQLFNALFYYNDIFFRLQVNHFNWSLCIFMYDLLAAFYIFMYDLFIIFHTFLHNLLFIVLIQENMLKTALPKIAELSLFVKLRFHYDMHITES